MAVTVDPLEHASRLLHDGHVEEAEAGCVAVLERTPRDAGANTLLGMIRLTSGNAAAAAACFRAAIAADPRSFDAYKGLGIALVNLNQPREAVASFRTALEIRPDSALAHYDLGVLQLDRNRLPEAIASLRRAIELQPDLAEAHFNLAVALGEADDDEAAIESYMNVLEHRPGFVEAHYNLGIALGRLERHAMSIANFQRVIEERPDFAEAHLNLGVALRMMGYQDQAVDSYRRALEINPRYAEAHNNLGIALANCGRNAEAVDSFRNAIAVEPAYAEAHVNLGMALGALGKDEAARDQLLKALSLEPGNADACKGLGTLWMRAGRYDQAVEAFQKAIGLDRPDSLLLTDLGHALAAAYQTDMAIAAFRQALDLEPRHAAARTGLATALTRARRYQEAIECCEESLRINGRDVAALDQLGDLCRHVCSWKNIDRITAKTIQVVEAKWPGISPFWFLAMVDDPAAHLTCAQAFWQKMEVTTAPPAPAVRTGADRLRVGYYSGDFNQHATSYLIAELLEVHDRTRFEIVALSLGPDDESPLRARVVKAVDRLIDLHGDSDEAIAHRIRAEQIDIVVDLDGHTRRGRLAALARRPAPVQVHYLGYPGSLGVDFIDYMLVDPFVAPPGSDAYFTEKLVRLPHCYQVSDRLRTLADPAPTRAECGLPDNGFVFCCLNNTYKITPPVFDVWMNLLRTIPNSVLWLLSDIDLTKENLRYEAMIRSIVPERLVFAAKAPTDVHLARHRLADLFLDTLPYNAHTTANDSLLAGVPVVTCAGRSFPARVAGSLLHTIGLDDLITTDLAAYEALARRLALDRDALDAVRARLTHGIAASPLFDTGRTCAAIEAAYLQMWNIRQRGEAPRAITLE